MDAHVPEQLAAPHASDASVALRNAVKLASSLVATWTVALVVKFQLPRFLGPNSFGQFNFAESFAAAFFVFVGLGIETYIQKEIPVRPKHASDFFGALLVLRGAIGLALLALMMLVLTLTGRPPETHYLALLFGVTYFVMGVNFTLAALLQASTKVGALAVQNVVSKLLWGVGLALGLWLRMPLVVLTIPLLTSELIKMMVLLRATREAIGLEVRVDMQTLKPVLKASLPFYVNMVAVNLASRLDVTLLEFLTHKREEVGWYGAANNFASLAMLLSPLVGWILMPLLSRAKHRSDEEFFVILRRAIEALVVAAVPVTLLIGLGADVWIQLAFGELFKPAAVSLHFLAPIFIATYMAMLLSAALVILGKSWRMTMISLAGLALQPVLTLLFVPIMARTGPGGAGAGAAIGLTVLEIFVTAMFWLSIGRQALDRRAVMAIVKSLGISVLVIALDRAVVHLGVWRLGIDMLVYAGLALLVGAVRLSDVKRLIVLLRTQRRERRAPS
jgi:O-antigen/teichoic acid export membrane protein